MRPRLVVACSVLLGAALLMGACGGGSSSSGGGGSSNGGGGGGGGGGAGTIDTTEKDFSIGVSPSSAAAGNITFHVTNDGPSVHEFVVFASDLAPDKLPLTKENGVAIVDEKGKGVKHIDELEDIKPGSPQDLSVNLKAGNYVLICNLPTHYKLGMHTAFTVK